jgi:type IV pilus assembly protein PilE
MMYKQERGMTLIELMIVVAVIGLLASIAYPAYQQIVLESRRADGQIALTRAANLQERHFSSNNSYSSTIGDIGGNASPDGYYQIAVTASGSSASYLSTYTLTATPVAPQDEDTACPSLTLNHLGQKTPAACWE